MKVTYAEPYSKWKTWLGHKILNWLGWRTIARVSLWVHLKEGGDNVQLEAGTSDGVIHKIDEITAQEGWNYLEGELNSED